MTEKQFRTLTLMIRDGDEITQTYIRSELSAPQLMGKIFKLKKENEQLRHELKEIKENPINYF